MPYFSEKVILSKPNNSGMFDGVLKILAYISIPYQRMFEHLIPE